MRKNWHLVTNGVICKMSHYNKFTCLRGSEMIPLIMYLLNLNNFRGQCFEALGVRIPPTFHKIYALEIRCINLKTCLSINISYKHDN